MRTIVEVTDTTYTVEVPITIRRRNGRPKIVLPDTGEQAAPTKDNQASAKLLRALARAWDWRRRLENGEASTLQDIAEADKVTLAFVARYIRLTYLAPQLIEDLVANKLPAELQLERLTILVCQPWVSQPALMRLR